MKSYETLYSNSIANRNLPCRRSVDADGRHLLAGVWKCERVLFRVLAQSMCPV